MDFIYATTIGLHTLAAVIWVGGMFFAHMALRPAVADMAPPERLALWRRTLPTFFGWVWASIATLLVTGYGVLLAGYKGGFTGGSLHIDVMQLTGLIMVVNFVVLFFGPWARVKRALAAGDIPAAGAAQNRVRMIVTINLYLGLFTVFIGAAGTFVGY